MRNILNKLHHMGVSQAYIARCAGLTRQGFNNLLRRKSYDRAAQLTREAVIQRQGELEEVNRILGELE